MKEEKEEQEEGSSFWSEVSNPDPFAPVWSHDPFSISEEDGSEERLASPGPETSVVAVRRPSYDYGPFIFSSPLLSDMGMLSPMLFLPTSRSPSPEADLRSYVDPDKDFPPSEAEKRKTDLAATRGARLLGYTEPDEGEMGDMSSSYCSSAPDMEAYMTSSWDSEEQFDLKSSYVLGQVLMSASHFSVLDHFIHKLKGIAWKTICEVGVNPGCKTVGGKQPV